MSTSGTGEGAQERRAHPRVDSLHLISFLNTQDGTQQLPVSMGRTLDVSAGGTRLEVLQSVESDSQMALDIAVRDEIVTVRGKVVRCQPTDEGRYILGIQFDEGHKELIDLL